MLSSYKEKVAALKNAIQEVGFRDVITAVDIRDVV